MSNKTRNKIIAYAITIGLLCLFLFLHFKTGNNNYLILAIVIAGIWLLLFTLGRLTNANGKPLKELTMQEAETQIEKHEDTSNWSKTKGVITRFIPLNKIIENGQVVAQLYYFYLQTEREASVLRTDKTVVGGHIIPISHVGSFSINTPVNVLVNKTGAWAIFDPEQEDWHYEKKD
jgi:heme/copper-type cytochrome/quinol oxidase subunit 4